MTPRRTNIEVLQALKEFIEKNLKEGIKEFHIGDIRESEVNVNSATATSWFEIVEFCQKDMPIIKMKKIRKNIIIEVAKRE